MNEDNSEATLKQDANLKRESSQTGTSSLQLRNRSDQLCHKVRIENQIIQQDIKLYNLIKLILSLEENEQQRRKTIDKLLKLIPNLNGVKKNLDPRINYDEAFNSALKNVWQNINSFPKLFHLDFDLDADNSDVNHVRICFVKWFNKILKRRIFDLYRQNKQQPFSWEQCGTQHVEHNLSRDIDPLEQLANQEWLDKLRYYLQQDPERILQHHPEGYPKCTCQELIQRRLLRETCQKWRDIAKELYLPQGTLTAFWYRKCLPVLQEIAEKIK